MNALSKNKEKPEHKFHILCATSYAWLFCNGSSFCLTGPCSFETFYALSLGGIKYASTFTLRGPSLGHVLRNVKQTRQTSTLWKIIAEKRKIHEKIAMHFIIHRVKIYSLRCSKVHLTEL